MGGSARLAVPAAALALIVSACSAGPAGAPTPSPPVVHRTIPADASPKPSIPFAPAADCEDATVGGALVTIRQVDNAFIPECLVVLGGQGLRVRNDGTVEHNFSIEGTQVSLDVEPGQQATTEPVATVAEPGTYRFFCRFHAREGMDGDLTITPAG